MTDVLTPEQRSYCMSQIRGKWTKPEQKVHNWLKGNKIKHEMHPDMEGSPDIALKDRQIAVFVHGCFWHKCPKCYREPETNKDFWIPKIEKNVIKDLENKKILEKNGWKTVVLWEHEIKKNFDDCIEKVRSGCKI